MKLSRTSREKHRPRIYSNRVLRRIFRPQREDVNKEVEMTAYEKLHDCIAHQTSLELSNQGEDGCSM
jgi:hypothetical protein